MPRPGSYFTPNRKEIQKFLNSEQVGKACLAAADDTKDVAVALAQRFRLSGHYIDSFKTEPTVVNLHWLTFNRGPRAGAVLLNDARYATVLEVGNSERTNIRRNRFAGYHTIARAAQAMEARR